MYNMKQKGKVCERLEPSLSFTMRKETKKMKKISNFFKLLFLVVFVGIIALSTNSFATVENEEQLLREVVRSNDDNPESTKYLVTDEVISNIMPGTTYGNFKANIEDFVEAYDKEWINLNGQRMPGVTDDDLVKTGKVLVYEINDRTYFASVLGDVNGGAEVIAGDNVIVLGVLRGLAHAGAKGNMKAIYVFSLLFLKCLRITKTKLIMQIHTYIARLKGITIGL